MMVNGMENKLVQCLPLLGGNVGEYEGDLEGCSVGSIVGSSDGILVGPVVGSSVF